jgi:hypothetical protein
MGSVSQWLEKSKAGDLHADVLIMKRFYEIARRVALGRINPKLRRYVSGSDIASTTLRNALKYAKDLSKTFESRDQFERLVISIAKFNSVSAVRKATTRKLRIDTEVPLGEMDVAAPETLGEKEIKKLELQGQKLGERIEKRLDQEPDKYLLMVDKLGILAKLKPNDIQKAVAKSFPKHRQYSIRWIEMRIAAVKKQLEDELRKDYSDYFKRLDDEREKKEKKQDEAKSRRSQQDGPPTKAKGKNRQKSDDQQADSAD